MQICEEMIALSCHVWMISIAIAFEFSLNYTKLETIPAKAYTGKNKINSAQKLDSVGIDPQELLIIMLY